MWLIEIIQGHLVCSAVKRKKAWAWWFNNFLSQNPIAAKQIKGGWKGEESRGRNLSDVISFHLLWAIAKEMSQARVHKWTPLLRYQYCRIVHDA